MNLSVFPEIKGLASKQTVNLFMVSFSCGVQQQQKKKEQVFKEAWVPQL